MKDSTVQPQKNMPLVIWNSLVIDWCSLVARFNVERSQLYIYINMNTNYCDIDVPGKETAM